MENLSEKDVAEYLAAHPKFVLEWMEANTQYYFPNSIADSGTITPNNNVVSSTQVEKTELHSTVVKFKSYIEAKSPRKISTTKTREALHEMTEKEMFLELIRDAASELDVNVLCHKILQNVSILTQCDRGSLFLAHGPKDNRYLVSKLFDVTSNSTLEESLHCSGDEIVIPFGCGIVGTVAYTKESINIGDAYKDARFNQEVDRCTGYHTHSILSMPIFNYEGEVIGVAQIINKISHDHKFTREDVQVFKDYLYFCGIGLNNAQLFEMSVLEYKRNEMLLGLARGIFEEQTSLERLMQKIMTQGRDLLKCARNTVYLLEDCFVVENIEESLSEERFVSVPASHKKNVKFSKGFDLQDGSSAHITVASETEIDDSRTAAVARYVAATGKYLCIPDLVKDGRFGNEPFINKNGFESKSMLCMPIMNRHEKIIGVTQLINKLNGQPFSDSDIAMLEAFSLFCGIGIHNCLMYERACILMAKKKVALEVLSYHASATNDEIERVMDGIIPTAGELHIYEFGFDDLKLSDDNTCRGVVRMFEESNLLTLFHIPLKVLIHWVCSVKKNYRPVIYHNWRHAFNVAQSMFCILHTGKMGRFVDDLEVLTLLVACLCHDLDHRGTNNAFQAKVDSPLALLYSTSTMEHHHFDHSIMILNSEGNNIFGQLDEAQYHKVLVTLEAAILATDLAVYFKKKNKFKSLCDHGKKDFAKCEEKDLLLSMMMTACDLAASSKPWEIQVRVAEMVAHEFFEQGDIEKIALHEKPIAMMDREKHNELPTMQVGFLDSICVPMYDLLRSVSGGMNPMFHGAMSNKEQWQKCADEFKKPTKSVKTDVLKSKGIQSITLSTKIPKKPLLMEAKKKPLHAQAKSHRNNFVD